MNIPDASKHLLCKSSKGRWGMADLYVIERTLGYRCWLTKGQKGRKDIAPLYANELVEEWFSPFSPPLFLTAKGVDARKAFRKELGYDD